MSERRTASAARAELPKKVNGTPDKSLSARLPSEDSLPGLRLRRARGGQRTARVFFGSGAP